MKFFNWMQNKFNGGQSDKRPNTIVTTNCTKTEEFNDWPHGLLTIGTFGNADPNETKQEINESVEQNPGPETDQCSSPDFSEFSSEEVVKLQKELTKLLSRKPPALKADQEQPSIADLPLDRFLNCPSSLEVDRTTSSRFSTYSDDKDEEEIDRTIRIILGRCKDVCEKKKKNKSIGKKSLTFLVKKMFACTSGFAPTPSLRDTFQESRMEKLLRTMLTNKIYSQKSSRKYLSDNKPTYKAENEEGSKWDKTDSEYIVLEI